MKYGPALTNKFCRSIRELKGRVAACKACGIDYQTFLRYMNGEIPKTALVNCKTPEEVEARKSEFCEHIKKAEEDARVGGKEFAIRAIFSGMLTHWQAGAWWLERQFPDEFKERLENTNKSLFDPKDIRRIREEMQRQMSEDIAFGEEVEQKVAEDEKTQEVPQSEPTPQENSISEVIEQPTIQENAPVDTVAPEVVIDRPLPEEEAPQQSFVSNLLDS